MERSTGLTRGATLILLFVGPLHAMAQCEPRDILKNDIEALNASYETQLAFALTSNEEQWSRATKNGAAKGGYGPIWGSADYGESKAQAQRLARATKFDYRGSYATNYLSQTLSGNALLAYQACLEKNKETPGLWLWVGKREGDFFTIRAYWVGRNVDTPTAKYDAEPVVSGATLVSKPGTWSKGKTEEMLVRRSGNDDFYVSLRVGGGSKSIVVVKDPPTVTWVDAPAKSDLLKTRSYGPNPGCTAGRTSTCITPSNPGGYFLLDTVSVTDVNTSSPAQFKTSFDLKTSQMICLAVQQGTGACQTHHSGSGRIMAIERFPQVDHENTAVRSGGK